MNNIEEFINPPSHFEIRVNQSLINTIRGIGRAGYTLFNVPDHDSSLYEDLAKVLIAEPQSVQTPLEEEIKDILSGPANLIDHDIQTRVNNKNLLGYMGVLMQFSSYLPDMRPYAQTPFEHIDNLYAQITERGIKKPLGFSDQLSIALEQTEGDLPEALWRLFITSRQHARWFDSSVILKMPEFTRDEKMSRMYRFSHAVAACKPFEESVIQDSSGDTYYAWTHALGRLVFNALPKKQSLFTKAASRVLYNGTKLMHKLPHRFKAQRLPSDHALAAKYGNNIGDVLVQVIKSQHDL